MRKQVSSKINEVKSPFIVGVNIVEKSIQDSYKDLVQLVEEFRNDDKIRPSLPLVGDCKRKCQEILNTINEIKREQGESV